MLGFSPIFFKKRVHSVLDGQKLTAAQAQDLTSLCRDSGFWPASAQAAASNLNATTKSTLLEFLFFCLWIISNIIILYKMATLYKGSLVPCSSNMTFVWPGIHISSIFFVPNAFPSRHQSTLSTVISIINHFIALLFSRTVCHVR